MYLDQLGEIEKIAFSRLAFKLISFYGIDDHEQKLYYAALGEMGIGEPDLEDEIEIATEIAAFTSMSSRRIALLELMLLALADGDLDNDEQHVLDAMISAFDFDEATLNNAWQWVNSWYGTFRVGKEFINVGELSLT